jgi:anti-anti-sigma factor
VSVASVGPSDYVVTASGALEGEDARRLRNALYPLAAIADAYVVLDLGGASYVDPATAGIVEGAAALVAARGGTLVVVTRDPRLRTLLELNEPRAVVEQSLARAFEKR